MIPTSVTNAHPVFQLLPITWQTFSTIGTFMAVIVAIALPAWRDRKRLKLKLSIANLIRPEGALTDYLHSSTDPNEPSIRGSGLQCFLLLDATNTGRTKMTVRSWEARKKGDRKGRMKIESAGREPPPYGLDSHQSIQLISGYLPEMLSGIIDMWIVDSTGRKWRVPGRELRRMRGYK